MWLNESKLDKILSPAESLTQAGRFRPLFVFLMGNKEGKTTYLRVTKIYVVFNVCILFSLMTNTDSKLQFPRT